MKPDLSRQRTRRHIVRPAERRKEVIQRRLVSHVDGGERKTPFVTFAFEQVVVAHRDIEKTPWGDALGIVVGVLRPGRWYLHQSRTILRWRTSGERCRECWALAAAEQSSLKLLIRGKTSQVHRSCCIGCEWHRACNQTAVIAPVEANPRPSLPGLVLQVSRFVELLVVVDTERAPTLPYRSPQTAGLRREETCGDARHHYQCRKPVELRHTHANCISRYLGIMPRDREEDRSRSQDAEIVPGVRVFPT